MNFATKEPLREIDGEWSLSPHELAVIHAQKGWQYATPTAGYGVPTEVEIRALLDHLVTQLAENDGASYVTLGRFLVIRDEDTPGTFDMYLHVGYVWNDNALSRELVND